MKPLYIFDLDGTIALTEHRQHYVQKPRCKYCAGHGTKPIAETATSATFAIDIDPPAENERCPHCEGSGRGTPDWKAFFAACVDDQPNAAVIETLHVLLDAGAEVRIWTGRSAEVMEQTKAWLMNHIDAEDLQLTMRVEGDYTPDEELKRSWYEQLSDFEKKRLVAVFDDRDKVVAMWRSLGVACFQVAPGIF